MVLKSIPAPAGPMASGGKVTVTCGGWLNLETELGMILLMAGSVPLYWDMWRSR
jgi:hypothetical protein